jgi:HAD superfamily hydrolase (TIGR01509 family)
MIIIIPIDSIPNIFINILDKNILSYLLDNLNLKEIDYIYIPYHIEYKKYNLEEILKKHYLHISFKFYCIENNTRSIVELINIGLKNLDESRDIPIICLDSYNFYLCDIISEWKGENCVFTFKECDENSIYKFIQCNNDQQVINIKDKEKDYNYACSGAYGFNSIHILKKYTSNILQKYNETDKLHITDIISEMINEEYNFKNIEINNKFFFSLRTPKLIDEYKHPFIFDLDGTLVNTDHIYILVWKTIMTKYKLNVDDNFFNFFIRGKNDIMFLTKLFPNISTNEIKEISELKDNLFIDYLQKYDKDIMISGAMNFINLNKNRKMGIVTSCNKKSAEFILKITKLDQYMQFLIASEDCTKHKPNKEPYEKAINILQCNKNNCFIFEDSNSGYKSALSLGINNICLIISDNSDNTILNANEYKIRNYDEFNLNFVINNEVDISKLIIKSLHYLPIQKVTFDNKDIKTGYICDIKALSLHLNNNIFNIILKIENIDNELSNVAREINLYSNEVYFYENISSDINIQVPKFYCSIVIDNKQCILLENLNDYEGNFNINLNEDIDVLMSVITNISNMHNYYYFNTEKELISCMNSLLKINEIEYYKTLINNRFSIFMKMNQHFMTDKSICILNNIYDNYNLLTETSGKYPLNFCHGDLKSPNIFYKRNSNKSITPFFLDWQYIHLNKGISDIVFLLVESINFDKNLNDIIIKYYYKKSLMYNNLEDLMFDFKISLCIFPFFVMVWFNSEDRDNLLDKVFPIVFMQNLLKYYNEYLDDSFFNKLCNISDAIV